MIFHRNGFLIRIFDAFFMVNHLTVTRRVIPEKGIVNWRMRLICFVFLLLCVCHRIRFFCFVYKSYVSSGVLTSWSTSWAAIAFSTFFFDVSCISPPINSSSNMKYAFSKLNIISSSHTCNSWITKITLKWILFRNPTDKIHDYETYTAKVFIQ